MPGPGWCEILPQRSCRRMLLLRPKVWRIAYEDDVVGTGWGGEVGDAHRPCTALRVRTGHDCWFRCARLFVGTARPVGGCRAHGARDWRRKWECTAVPRLSSCTAVQIELRRFSWNHFDSRSVKDSRDGSSGTGSHPSGAHLEHDRSEVRMGGKGSDLITPFPDPPPWCDICTATQNPA